jgi:hypothetical protein
MPRPMPRQLLPMLGLFLAAFPGCIKSVCETNSDCPAGNLCSGGACIKACTSDPDCPAGRYCERTTGRCATGCRSSSECTNAELCVQNQCWAVSGPSADGGQGDGGVAACSCLQAPRACLVDINPASTTVETSVCQPGEPPRASALFFGNLGCSHCQVIFGNLLLIESELWSEGFDPMLVFVQLKDFTYAGADVTATFPTHRGPLLQDTASEDMWKSYGADWYDVKIIDAHGCLSAFFTADDTQYLIAGGELQEAGNRLKDAWRAALGSECHGLPDAGLAEAGP